MIENNKNTKWQIFEIMYKIGNVEYKFMIKLIALYFPRGPVCCKKKCRKYIINLYDLVNFK